MAEKPIVHLIHKSETNLIPFDVKPYRTVSISWDTPGEVRQSVQQLITFIEAAISPDHNVENPVTRARGRQHLRETATPTEKVLMEEMQGLTARITDLERLSPPVPNLFVQPSNTGGSAREFTPPMGLVAVGFGADPGGHSPENEGQRNFDAERYRPRDMSEGTDDAKS
jgi:hypothetical protein